LRYCHRRHNRAAAAATKLAPPLPSEYGEKRNPSDNNTRIWMIVELYYHACDVVWRWVVFPEKNECRYF
jgi:hypothetical protein